MQFPIKLGIDLPSMVLPCFVAVAGGGVKVML